MNQFLFNCRLNQKTLLLMFLGLVILMLFILPEQAHASVTGAGNAAMPWEGNLNKIAKSFTGPVAFALSVIGIVGAGMTLLLAGGEMGAFPKTLVGLVLIISLCVAAPNIVTVLGGQGATIALASQFGLYV